MIVGIQDQKLRSRLVARQIVRDQAGALIGRGRTAHQARGNADCDYAAIVHGAQPRRQTLRLLTRLPGVRHDLRRGGIVALRFIPQKADTGRDHQAIEGQHLTALDPDTACVHIDGEHTIADQRDAGVPNTGA